MTRRRFGPLVETFGVLSLGAGAIYAALLPVSHLADGLPTPDLVACLAAAWVVRRPAEAPLWAILLLGLAADLLLSRPLGLGALALLGLTELLRGQAAGLRAGAFVFEWAVVALLIGASLAAMQVVLDLTLYPGAAGAALAAQAALTALAYPLVVWALALGLGMKTARRSRDADRLGRLP